MHKALHNLKPVTGFKKTNTIDNLFNSYYGFNAGVLLIEVIELKGNLRHDPYCELKLEKQKFLTQVAPKENPQWKEEFLFEVSSAISPILVSLCRWQRIVGRKLLGEVTLNIKDFGDGKVYNQWYKITNPKNPDKSFEIRLQIQYTNIASRNLEFRIAKQNYDILISLLTSKDLVIISTLCKIYESEELSKTLIRLFYADGFALRLLVQLIYREIRNTKTGESLFRVDSMVTKMVRNYFKLIAFDYLDKTMTPILQKIIENPKGFEIDMTKASGSENITDNAARLAELVQYTIDTILSSLSDVPLSMRKLFNILRQMVHQVFPSLELKSIGAFFFLRYITPCIVSPHTFGLPIEPIENQEVKRCLTLVCKILQNLANGAQFHEEYMKCVNPIIEKNKEAVLEFFSQLSEVPETGPPDFVHTQLTEDDKIKALSLVLGQILKNLDKIEQELPNDPGIVRLRGTEEENAHMETFQQFKDILLKAKAGEKPRNSTTSQ